MSWRELRNFSNTMQLLGYPYQISLDAFRTPNFDLMANVLIWLIKRFGLTSCFFSPPKPLMIQVRSTVLSAIRYIVRSRPSLFCKGSVRIHGLLSATALNINLWSCFSHTPFPSLASFPIYS